MLNHEFFPRLEQLQREYFSIESSTEYRIGTKFKNLANAIRKHQLREYLQKEWIYRKNKKYSVPLTYSEFEYGEYPEKETKIAVYSCITGGYDNIIEPFFSIDGVDYIMFTDNKKISTDKWQIVPIPKDIAKLKNNLLINRYIKMHPNIVGTQYDYSLYIDGNICVVSNIRNMINAINPKTGFALHGHISRDCIYDEIQVCKNMKKGNIEKLIEQANRYQTAGFPRHYGLLEATVILTDLHNPIALDLQNKWWHEFLNSESRRDQIALPYILWQNKIPITYMNGLGCPVQRNPKFRKYQHK